MTAVRNNEGQLLWHTRTETVRGEDRTGIRAGDWLTETTDLMAKLRGPQFEKPANLIESIRIEDAEQLTAKAWALSEYLFASARKNGIEKEFHDIEMGVLSRYLDVAAYKRIEDLLKKLLKANIRYDVRDGDKRIRAYDKLFSYELHEHTRRGEAVLRHRIPEVVRTAVLRSTHYAWLDINVFAQFTSKYSARLYNKFALMAMKPDDMSRKWEVSPLALAEFVAYPMKKDQPLHFGTFERAISRAMEEIQGTSETSDVMLPFRVEMEPPTRGTTKGRPNGNYVFRTSEVRREFNHHAAADLSKRQYRDINKPDDRLSYWEHPAPALLARAQTMLGLDAARVSAAWRDWLADADQNLKASYGGVETWLIVRVLNQDGVEAAFTLWLPAFAAVRRATKKAEAAAEAARPVPTKTLPAFLRKPMPVVEVEPQMVMVTVALTPAEMEVRYRETMMRVFGDKLRQLVDPMMSKFPCKNHCDIEMQGGERLMTALGKALGDKYERALRWLHDLDHDGVRRTRLAWLLEPLSKWDFRALEDACDHITATKHLTIAAC